GATPTRSRCGRWPSGCTRRDPTRRSSACVTSGTTRCSKLPTRSPPPSTTRSALLPELGERRWLRGVRLDPAVEGGAALEARDERIARHVPGVADDVPQTLGVEDELGAAVERNVLLGLRVGEPVLVVLHEDHEAVWEVGELEPRPDDPAPVGRIESVVVVAVDL